MGSFCSHRENHPYDVAEVISTSVSWHNFLDTPGDMWNILHFMIWVIGTEQTKHSWSKELNVQCCPLRTRPMFVSFMQNTNVNQVSFQDKFYCTCCCTVCNKKYSTRLNYHKIHFSNVCGHYTCYSETCFERLLYPTWDHLNVYAPTILELRLSDHFRIRSPRKYGHPTNPFSVICMQINPSKEATSLIRPLLVMPLGVWWKHPVF